MGYVYKITNLIDGKIYIGKSVSNYLDRYKEHLKIANNWEEMQQTCRSHLYSAMYKYGVENFEICSVEECSNDILSEREKYYISKFNSQDPGTGYNIASGGAGGDTFSALTEEEKKHRSEKMSIALRNKTRGYVAIHKDTVNKRVPPEVLENYLNNGHKPFYSFRIIVGEKQTFSTIQCFNRCHILSIQCEIKHVKILLHTILMNRLRDDNNIAL